MTALVIVVLALAGPARGLSCKVPNFAEAFNYIAEVPEVYSLGYGSLEVAGPVPELIEGQPRTVSMRFVGRLLGGRGFGAEQSIDVVVETACAGAWCGPMPKTGTPTLLFLEHRGAQRYLNVPACPGDTHLASSLGQVAAVRACMRQGVCGAAEIAAFDLN